MKVLITGSGGREHALAALLAASPATEKLYAWPGSDAISRLATEIDAPDVDALVDALVERGVDLCVVGPEKHLEAGLADRCRARAIRCWGPVRTSARLETSKSFAKQFMARHDIATGDYVLATTPDEIRRAVGRRGYPAVLKYDGLAGGKGVSVCRSDDEVDGYIREVFDERRFGDAGPVLVEEFFEGAELSAICAVCDGGFHLFPLVRDHKRLRDGGHGPNTGGMGAVAGPQLVSEDTRKAIETTILRPVVRGLCDDDMRYRGFLYAGLMITDDGPRVLEFNCRFGDPEAQAVAPLLGGDPTRFFHRAAGGTLQPDLLAVRSRWSTALTLAAPNYPIGASRQKPISGLDDTGEVHIYHAGTRHTTAGWETDGGRVLTLVATAEELGAAQKRVYAAAEHIDFEGMQYRTDIGGR